MRAEVPPTRGDARVPLPRGAPRDRRRHQPGDRGQVVPPRPRAGRPRVPSVGVRRRIRGVAGASTVGPQVIRRGPRAGGRAEVARPDHAGAQKRGDPALCKGARRGNATAGPGMRVARCCRQWRGARPAHGEKEREGRGRRRPLHPTTRILGVKNRLTTAAAGVIVRWTSGGAALKYAAFDTNVGIEAEDAIEPVPEEYRKRRGRGSEHSVE